MQWLTERRSVVVLPHKVDVFLRVASRLMLLVVVSAFTYEAVQGNIPRDPEGGAFTEGVLVPLQLGLLALTAIGLLLSFRWIAVAAAVIAFGGSGLGTLATLQYEPPFGLFVLAAFLVPAVMMWLDWQHQETLAKIVVLAVATAAILLGSWIGASQVYASYLGPTHPESDTIELARSPVQWLWSGAVDTDGFTVTARLRDPAEMVRLVIRAEDGAEVFRSGPEAVPDSEEPLSLRASGLTPDTSYSYVLEVDGVIDEIQTGHAMTFAEGASSFTVAVGACARTNSNGIVFDTIRDQEPDLYINTGDMHYRNIAENNPDAFGSAFAQVHRSAAQSALYRSVPLAYVWDDHDYGPNDADADSPSRGAALTAYRTNVPHYELPSGDGGAINQAFTIGRVRFLVTDTRSERRPADGVMLGETQLQWLLDELLAARDTHALTIWVSPTPWIGVADPLSDHWGGFAAERDLIGAFLHEHAITNLAMVAGDAHMVAIDDGTNSGYGGHDGFPVLQAAALDRPGSIKGGPYSHGTLPGGGQFGLIEVTDDGGDQIGLAFGGLDYNGVELLRLEVRYDVNVG